MSRKRENARRRAIANVLATAPGLGAFATAVGQLGLDGAVELCATREPPERVQLIWGTLGHHLEQLPSAEDIRCLLLGIEAKRRQEVTRANHTPPVPIFVMAEDMGCQPLEIQRGLKLLGDYGGSVNPRMPDGKALGVL